MFKISCFADELDSNFASQLRIMEDEGIRWLSLRTADGTNVLQLTDAQVRAIAADLRSAGVGVSSIGSPIGKSPIEDESGLHVEQTKRAVEIAKTLDCNRIRVFSFFMKPEERVRYCDRVIDRMREISALAAEAGVILMHENEADIYGTCSSECLDLMESVGMPNFKAVFDPANFVIAGEKPFDESFPKLQKHIDYLHIKDYSAAKGTMTPAGEGDGQIPAVLDALRDKEFFLTLEPHLVVAERSVGFSGPEMFGTAVAALRGILDDLQIEYQ